MSRTHTILGLVAAILVTAHAAVGQEVVAERLDEVERTRAKVQELVAELLQDQSVAHRNQVRRNIARQISFQRLSYTQKRHRSATFLIIELPCSLHQLGMNVENITGIRLSAWWPLKQQ